MTSSLHLPFTIYHLPLISHFSFTNWKMLIDHLLQIVNCELEIKHRRCV